MTISPFTIYLITRLDWLAELEMTITTIAILAFLVAIGVHYLAEEEENDEMVAFAKKVKKITLTLIIVFFPLAFATPNTNEAIAMYVIPAIANNQNIQKLPTNILTLVDKFLEQKSNQN